MSWKTIWVIAADGDSSELALNFTSGDYVIAEDGRASALRNGSASQAAFNVALDNNMAGRMPSLVSTSTNRYSFGGSSCCHLAKDAERQVRPFCLA